MKYNFDELIDRHNTNAYKLELCKKVFGSTDLLPLWVADMDFRTPDFILDAIKKRCEHPILGYTVQSDVFYDDLQKWLLNQHNWKVEKQHMGFLGGIVPGIAYAVNALTNPDEEILVQTPVYPPFFTTPMHNGRKVLFNQLIEKDGLYEMDFEGLESLITDKTKLMILCNPHNPGGRVWDKETLLKIARICHKHGIVVVSDEIHSDMCLKGYNYIPFSSVSDEASSCSITFVAPTKTFNMPGLASSAYIISNSDLRARFFDFLYRMEQTVTLNPINMAATHAAYSLGDEWRRQMLDYVEANLDYVISEMAVKMPLIKPMRPQASFLLWLDFSAYGLSSDELQHKIVNKAKLALNKGTSFGLGGEQYFRMNVATPRSVLEEAIMRLGKVFA